MLEIQFDDDIELHEVVVRIVRLIDGAMVFQKYLHQHGNSYRWVEFVNFEVDQSSDFEIRAIATDHELQRTEATAIFRIEAEE